MSGISTTDLPEAVDTTTGTTSTPTRRSIREQRTTARRRRAAAIAGGIAAVIAVGGTLAVTTRPELGEALGVPSASATPTLSGPELATAQAKATIMSAQDVIRTANPRTDTTPLRKQVVALTNATGGAIQPHIESTVAQTDRTAQDSATAAKQQADAASAAKAAADAAAAKAAQEAAAAAQAAANTPAGARATAQSMAASRYGWGADQFSCLNSLWTKESGWNYRAYNPSGATGIPQALPGSKMSTIAGDWQTNATTQIAWGLGYIRASYGTPCAAWAHSEATNYY
jgi:hypothetical protein